MQNKEVGTTGTESYDSTRPVHRKFTLTTDCEGLISQDADFPHYLYTSKSADEAVRFLQLDTLTAVSSLDQIKVKCFHTCESLRIEEGACLKTLWRIGDWFMEKYEALGKSVECEHLTNEHERDLSEPDATLIVFIYQNPRNDGYGLA
jgi:hypothetical protein